MVHAGDLSPLGSSLTRGFFPGGPSSASPSLRAAAWPPPAGATGTRGRRGRGKRQGAAAAAGPPGLTSPAGAGGKDGHFPGKLNQPHRGAQQRTGGAHSTPNRSPPPHSGWCLKRPMKSRVGESEGARSPLTRARRAKPEDIPQVLGFRGFPLPFPGETTLRQARRISLLAEDKGELGPCKFRGKFPVVRRIGVLWQS